MTARTTVVSATIAIIGLAQAAAAQQPRTVQDLRLRAPAAFNTAHCLARIEVANAPALKLPGAGEISVLIDNVHRQSLRALPQSRRDVYFVTFAPHHSLCDGRTHRVDLTWNGSRTTTYQVVFPWSGQFSSVDRLKPPAPITR